MASLRSTNCLRSTFLTGSLAVLTMLGLACSQNRTSRDVESDVKRSLDNAGLKDVKVDQDRDKGVVRLSGEVTSEEDKARAEQVVKSAAPDQIVANEVAVRPPGAESEAKGMQSNLDSAIEDNFKAQLIANRMNTGVDFEAKEGVLTITGNVATQQQRQKVEQLAASVPNVKQVVNEVEVKNEKATASR